MRSAQTSKVRDPRIGQAHTLDQAGRHPEALALLHQAAAAGDAVAMTFLGSRLVTGRAAPFEPEQGAAWLIRAGDVGGPAALRLASALRAAGVGAAADPSAAVKGLTRAAQGGDADAKGQLAALSGGASRFDVKSWLTAPSAEVLSADPRVAVFRRFLTPSVCDWIRGRASGRLEGTAVSGADGGGDRAMEIRTASGAGFALLDTDVVMALVRARISATLDTPVRRFEPVNVLHYEPGQQYRPHFDFFNTAVPHFARIVAAQGQRNATFLIYLNDDYEGGETEFPELGIRFKARVGDALHFVSAGPDGVGDPRTLHAGLPPASGTKWLLSQWIRNRPQPIV